MTRFAHVRLVPLALTLACGLVIALPAHAAPVPERVAALGDSITKAFGSHGLQGDNDAASWATGSSIDSHVQRLAQLRGQTIEATNLAVSGRRFRNGGITPQATALPADTSYVLIGGGSADVCAGSIVNPTQMTSVASFRTGVDAVLQAVRAKVGSDVPILVSSIANWYRVWESFPESADLDRPSTACPLLFQDYDANGDGAVDSGEDAVANQYRAELRDRTIAFNSQLQAACAATVNCTSDGGAVYALTLAFDDLSAYDRFHPSAAGEAKIAAATWNEAFYAKDFAPPPVSSFTAVLASGSITLAWENPVSGTEVGDVDHVRIVRKTSSEPQGPDDGVVVCDCAPGTASTTDGAPDPAATYHYAAYVVDEAGQLSDPVRTSVTGPEDTTPPAPLSGFTAEISGGVRLSWENPAEDLDRVEIVRKSGSEPQGPEDGDVLCDDCTGETLTDPTVPQPGETVHYAAYAVDANDNRSDAARASVSGPEDDGGAGGSNDDGSDGDGDEDASGDDGSGGDGSGGGDDEGSGGEDPGDDGGEDGSGDDGVVGGSGDDDSGDDGDNEGSGDESSGDDSGGSRNGNGGGGNQESSPGGSSQQSSGGGGGGLPPDLELSGLALPGTVLPGETLVYHLEVRLKNLGGATSIVLTTELPPGLDVLFTYADRGSGCNVAVAGQLTCRLDWLSPGLVAHVTIVVRASRPGDAAFRASVRAHETDPDLANNVVATPVAIAAPRAPASVQRRSGTAGPDRIGGADGVDVLLGLAGSDFLWGYGGPDSLLGGAGVDHLYGGTGDDVVQPGSGRDVVDAGAGNDHVFAVDGWRDLVRCGEGHDRVVADAFDSVASDCEIVVRPT